MNHAGKIGLMRRKLKPEQVVEIKRLLEQGFSHNHIANFFPVTRGTITAINIGKTWKHI